MTTFNSIFFHSPSSILMETIIFLHDYAMIFLTSIMILIMINIIYSFYFKFYSLEFFEHHEMEFIWTVIPFIILFSIVVPSLFTLYNLDTCIFCGLSISILGHQWYWSYFYKDFTLLNFDSYMNVENSLIRLLEVDNRLILPNYMPVRFLLSSVDVIHSWTVPSLGVKMDAVPGRINQFCLSSSRSGVFFGQCSEICGSNHSFMPIVVEFVPFKNFMDLF